MKRLLALLVAAVAVLVIASACPSTPDSKPCGDPATFDLAGCDIVSLQTLEPGGIWNTEIEWLGGMITHGTLNLTTPGAETISTQPVDAMQIGERSFYLATTYERDGRTYRLVYNGCGATDPRHVGGRVHFCSDGNRTMTGLFKAGRLARLSGEAESSQIVLRSELPLGKGTPSGVFVAGGYAYVPAQSGMAIFDVREPASPAAVAWLEASTADAGVDYWNDALVRGNVLYVASLEQGILYYDVSNPAQPVKLGSLPAEKLQAHRLSVDEDGDRLYATSPTPKGEVLIVDISNPTAPALVSRFQAELSDPVSGRWPSAAVASGDMLYVAHRALGYVIADVTGAGTPDAGTPREVGGYIYPGKVASSATVVGSFGDKTIAFEGSESWDGHLRVLDVTNPAAIAQIAELKKRPEISIHQLALVGTRLYTAYYQDGLRVLDVSNPASPTPIAHFNTWRETDPGRGRSFFEGASGIHVPGDGHIYVTDTSRGLMIFDEL